MTNMIERVADAIISQHDTYHSTFLDSARAAIAAMREPTPAMLEAADAVMLHRPVVEKPDRLSTLTLGFNAMIDAALECSTKPDEK
jgi:citrate lyase beta subunit